MALPKQKTARARKGKRRSHLGISVPALVYCPQCNSPKLPHHVCLTCGSYAGRGVIEIKTPKKKTS
ncbi:MAG: 50S ribosomal protein L32 [Dehalococcoidales bacterium]